MVTIHRQLARDGYYFEIGDFSEYVDALRQVGIDPPLSHYRVFVSFDDERRLRESCPNWEEQVKLFFKLGASVSIPARIVAS